MLSRVVLNALIEINVDQYTRAHANTHKFTYLQMQLYCFTAICVMCVSLLQFIFCKWDMFVIRFDSWKLHKQP